MLAPMLLKQVSDKMDSQQWRAGTSLCIFECLYAVNRSHVRGLYFVCQHQSVEFLRCGALCFTLWEWLEGQRPRTDHTHGWSVLYYSSLKMSSLYFLLSGQWLGFFFFLLASLELLHSDIFFLCIFQLLKCCFHCLFSPDACHYLSKLTTCCANHK